MLISRFLFSRKSIITFLTGGVVLVGTNMVYRATPVAKHTAHNPSSQAKTTDNNTNVPSLETLAPPLLTRPTVPTTKPAILARSFIVIDSQSKYPLAAKDPDVPVAIASTTKIMTSLVALDTYPNLDAVLTVPGEAATVTGSEIHLMTDEKMTVRSLLYAMLLSSANDAAYTLASGKGDKAAFVARMNEKAELLGLKNTHYLDPAGLDDSGHSSPHDLALLMDYGLKNQMFRTIIGTATTTIWSADQKYKHDLKNSNRLIEPDEPLFYAKAIGGKTGFTYEAGHCLVAVADYGANKRHIAVVLHTSYETNDASAREARKLLTWASGI